MTIASGKTNLNFKAQSGVFRSLMAISALAMSTIAFNPARAETGSAAGSVTAKGAVFYKMPAGELVKREASLEVPARGQGDVILRSGDLELKAHGFKTVRKLGRSIFYVVFLNPPGAPANTAAVYRGTYLRGSNAAKYWGDVFSKVLSDNDLTQGKTTVESLIADLERTENKDISKTFDGTDVSGSDWRHSGGFWFGVQIGG
jgi:hypothetical protein